MFDTLNSLHALWAMLLGYALGATPFGLLFTKMAGLGDIRAIGSGNIGATNVLRTGHKGLAAATLVADMLKGTFAVLLAALFWGVDYGLIAGLFAFLGHLFPAWLNFRGGKGVATFIGVLIGWRWEAALVFGLIWIGCAYITRYSSLSALVASAASPLVLWLFGMNEAMLLAIAMVVLLYWKHSENITRLRAGTEGRIGQKAAPAEAE